LQKMPISSCVTREGHISKRQAGSTLRTAKDLFRANYFHKVGQQRREEAQQSRNTPPSPPHLPHASCKRLCTSIPASLIDSSKAPIQENLYKIIPRPCVFPTDLVQHLRIHSNKFPESSIENTEIKSRSHFEITAKDSRTPSSKPTNCVKTK